MLLAHTSPAPQAPRGITARHHRLPSPRTGLPRTPLAELQSLCVCPLRPPPCPLSHHTNHAQPPFDPPLPSPTSPFVRHDPGPPLFAWSAPSAALDSLTARKQGMLCHTVVASDLGPWQFPRAPDWGAS